ncbi:phosphatidylserine synthase, partial [Pseudomonas syringae pv. actinidiae]|nr:phosphatidylserine synthase [Pseudomonas syringae pv. actinidiae]
MQSTFRRSTLAALRGFALPSDAISNCSFMPPTSRRCLLEKIASATR